MKDDTREKRWQDSPLRLFPRNLPRFALLAVLALVVISLGVALIPKTPGEPAEPPFSEQARAAALADTLRLKTAGEQLSLASPVAGSGAGQPAVSQAVTLLTTQARALLVPGGVPAGASAALPSSTPSPSPSSSPQPSPQSSQLPSSTAGLAAALASSGGQRLADAAVADGGLARLLAAVGTAQLLQASSLTRAGGAAAPQADLAPPEQSGECPSAAATASSPVASTGSAGGASLEAALAAAVRAEVETVYGYQVALTRLSGDASRSASEQLATHEALVSGAEALSRMHCAPVPPREAGYTLAPSFLAAPATGLAGLETATLPVYGDLVALSDGETRQWAISGLLGASRRAALWGADPGPLPGLTADPAAFPPLP